jgi:hypothetical protein
VDDQTRFAVGTRECATLGIVTHVGCPQYETNGPAFGAASIFRYPFKVIAAFDSFLAAVSIENRADVVAGLGASQGNRDQVLESIIHALKNKYHCHTIVLYGSRARGRTRRLSVSIFKLELVVK